MKEVEVLVFGTNAPVEACGCGCSCGTPSECGPAKTMQEEAGELKAALLDKFGEGIKFYYVDVDTEEMKNYPEITKVLPKVRLPLTVINGKPKFHGGFSSDKIAGAISELLQENK